MYSTFHLFSCLHRYSTFPLSISLSPTIFLCFSPWQACCSAFGDRACYRGHADECRSIWTPKPQHPWELRACACMCVLMRVVCTGICACISGGVWARCLAHRLGTCGCCCHSFHCALEGVESHCTGMKVCLCMMDLDFSLWGIIWTASTAIFDNEYFIIL